MFAPSSNPNPREPGREISPERPKTDPELARQELTREFRRLVEGMGYESCSPANGRMDTPEMQERKVTGDPLYMCQRFVSDFVAIAQRSRPDGLLGVSVNLEGIGKSSDGGRAVCLLDAHDTRTGQFLAPLDIDPPDSLPAVRMPSAMESISGGVGIVGRFESRTWAHPTFNVMYTKDAFSDAIGRLDTIGELVATARSQGSPMIVDIPVASSLMSLLLRETEKKARLDALLDEAIYGPDDNGANKTIGITRLERDADGTIVLGTYMLGDTVKGHGSLVLAQPVERTHRMSLTRDEYGLVSVEILSAEDRKV